MVTLPETNIVPAITRIIPFVVGNPYKPYFICDCYWVGSKPKS